MTKRKSYEDSETNNQLVPLPIQTFLWRQSRLTLYKYIKLYILLNIYIYDYNAHYIIKILFFNIYNI